MQEIVQVADAWSMMGARLRLAIAGQNEFVTAQKALFEIAQRMGVPIQEVSTLYGKLQQAVRSRRKLPDSPPPERTSNKFNQESSTDRKPTIRLVQSHTTMAMIDFAPLACGSGFDPVMGLSDIRMAGRYCLYPTGVVNAG